MIIRWALALALVVIGTLVHAAEINSVRLWRSPDNTRVVFDLSAPVEHKQFALTAPHRVVVDIADTSLAASVADLPLGNTPIKKIRFGKRGGGLRVVFDLKTKTSPSSFTLVKQAGKPDRLVVDLTDEGATSKSPVQTVHSAEELGAGKRDIVIAVDAGHGGEDPGAIGPHRLHEKDVVLSISKALVGLINKEPGYKAYLVRTGDYYIPLRNRRNKARELRADLFVSIHADAFKDPRASGASVFALSRSGATSETARFLATKENEADLIGGVGGVDLKDVDNVLAGVLVDLSMTATMSHSLDVGERVLREMGAMTKLHKKQVEQAGFAVLKSPDVPSILVETGFISNPHEANKLSTSSYRMQMAQAIFRGVKSYFYDVAPAGSLLAWQKANSGVAREYVIARGDTLSAIAKRYNVSLQSLLEHNGLNRQAVIKVGQRLLIPTS